MRKNTSTAAASNIHQRKMLSGQVIKKGNRDISSNPMSNNESFETNNNSSSIAFDTKGFDSHFASVRSSIDSKSQSRTKDPPKPSNSGIKTNTAIVQSSKMQNAMHNQGFNNHDSKYEEGQMNDEHNEVTVSTANGANGDNTAGRVVGQHGKNISSISQNHHKNRAVSFGNEDSMPLNIIPVHDLIEEKSLEDQIIDQSSEISTNQMKMLEQQMMRQQSKSKKSAPRKSINSEAKDFQVAYKQLSKHILKQIVEEKDKLNQDSGSKVLLDDNNSLRIPLTDRLSMRDEEKSIRESSKIQMLLLSEREAMSYIQEESIITATNDEKEGNGFKNESIHLRLYNEHKEFQQKKRELSQLRLGEDLAECTFKPTISTNHNRRDTTSERRSYQDFYAEMLNFKEMKEKKVEVHRKILEEKELQECQVRSISRGRMGTTSDWPLNYLEKGMHSTRVTSSNDIHSRLFNQQIKNVRLSTRMSPRQADNNENSSVLKGHDNNATKKSPRLNSSEITMKLYEDAKKRREDRSLNTSSDHSHDIKYKTSAKSNEVCTKRILRQIERAFTDLGCLDFKCISLEIFSDLLSYLGFAGDDLSQRERMVKDAWKLLGGSDSRNVSKRSFIIFINSLNNIYQPWMSEHQLSPESSNQNQMDFLIKSEQEMQQIHYKFFAFWEYRSKMKLSTSQSNLHHITSQNLANENQSNNTENKSGIFRLRDPNISERSKSPNFKPTINQKSQALANQKLKKELQELNIPYNHQEYLIKKGQQLKERLKEKKEEIVTKEASKCTFKPLINVNTNRQREKSVFEGLYELKDEQNQKTKRNERYDEYEKQKSECTFKPDLHKSTSTNRIAQKKASQHSVTSLNKDQSYTQKYKQKSSLNTQISQQNPFKKSQNSIVINPEPPQIKPYQKGRQLQNDSKQFTNQSNNSRQTQDFSSEQQSFNAQIPEDKKIPILFLDVNLGQGKSSRLVLYQGDKPEDVANDFIHEQGLDQSKKEKLLAAIYQQLSILADGQGFV